MAVPNLWRTKKQRYSLQGEICSACQQAVFPPREICPHCGLSMHRATRVKPQNELYSFTLMQLPAQVEVAAAGDD